VRDGVDDAEADGCRGGCAIRSEGLAMDVSAIIGEELKAVEFVEDFLQLRFEAPLLIFYAWPHVLFPEFSVAYGEPEYRNALCAQINDKVVQASLEEGDALTIEFENGTVFGLSLREEDVDGPESGSYSETGDASDAQEF
jgi:hypothetical protein